MGLLDEAIKEHLELKRRRGADPTEVTRQEQEALGPVRREPDPAEAPLADAPPPAAAEAAAPPADLPPADATQVLPLEPAVPDPEDRLPPQGDPFAIDAAAAPHTEPAPPPERAEHEIDFFRDEDTISPEPEPAPTAPEPAAEAPPAAPSEPAPATQEFDVEAEAEVEPEETGDEDVLEETPEFLQETPEHDRLWFEQRPPRDFDFDG